MPKHDPNVDFTYSVGCGCRVTFFGASECHTSRMDVNPECKRHAGGMRDLGSMYARNDLQKSAKDYLRQAIDGTL